MTVWNRINRTQRTRLAREKRARKTTKTTKNTINLSARWYDLMRTSLQNSIDGHIRDVYRNNNKKVKTLK